VRKHIGTIVKLVIGLGLIAFVLTRLDFASVSAKLTSANMWLVGLGLLLFWLAMTINAVKWWVLLRAQDIEIPFIALLEYTFVGFFFNNVLPANIGGDVMRGWGLARYTDRTAAAAASVVLDRLIGLSTYMIVAAIASVITVVLTGRQDLQILAWASGGMATVLLMLGVVLLSRRLRSVLDHLLTTSFLRPLLAYWQPLSQAFEAYRFKYRALLVAFGVALLGITSTSLVNYVLSESLGGGISLLHIFLFNPLIALVLIVPISIGGLGLNQVAYPFFYRLVGVPEAHAFGLSLFVQAVQIVCSLPGALLWLRWRRRDQAAPGREPDHAV